ncbi:MAG TPA: LLM class flavin-dependent oxidoreductase [Chloroflexota bacterium]|nr:LLM class flavin-dependent oxidoreductase [Chloroflexota bacterium]
MEFSIFALPTYFQEQDPPQGDYLRRLIDLLASVEELGYDGIWANEHHFHPYGGMIPSPAVLLAALIQRTKRVRLGTSVVVLPLHHPIEVAEQLAMVDLMSDGRLELGVGRGFVPYDYQNLGVSFEEGQERTQESLEIILAAWSQPTFSYTGKHYRFDNIELWPRPQQRPHPPVWIACTGTPSSFTSTGAKGYNLLTVSSLRPMEKLGELARLYRDAWNASGRDPGGYRYATHFQVVVDDDRDRARRIASDAIRNYFGLHAKALALHPASANRGFDPLEGFSIERWIDEGRILAGTPDDVVATLRRAQAELGITGIDGTFFFGGVSFEVAERSLRLFAEGVIPRMRSATPATAAVG